MGKLSRIVRGCAIWRSVKTDRRPSWRSFIFIQCTWRRRGAAFESAREATNQKAIDLEGESIIGADERLTIAAINEADLATLLRRRSAGGLGCDLDDVGGCWLGGRRRVEILGDAERVKLGKERIDARVLGGLRRAGGGDLPFGERLSRGGGSGASSAAWRATSAASWASR